MKDGGRGMRTGMVQRRQGAKRAPVENARRRPFTADGWSSASPLASTRRTHLVLDIIRKKKHFLIKPHPTNTRRKLPNPSPLNKNCNFVPKKVQIKNEISNYKCRVYYAIIKKLFDVCVKLYLKKKKRYNNGVDTFVAR